MVKSNGCSCGRLDSVHNTNTEMLTTAYNSSSKRSDNLFWYLQAHTHKLIYRPTHTYAYKYTCTYIDVYIYTHTHTHMHLHIKIKQTSNTGSV